jgi:hypothetical protein
VAGDLGEGGWRGRGGCGREGGGKFALAGGQLPGAGLELGQPVGEVFGVEGAGLERRQVAVGCRVGFREFAGDGGVLVLAGALAGPVVVLGLGDGVRDEVVLVTVKAGQAGGDSVSAASASMRAAGQRTVS